jgi:catechol 2,3-dioxygenase-like lactoylglutathione lyase family enzyme
MLGDAMVTPMVGTVQPDASKAFYQDVLGLKFLSEDQFAAIYEGRNARLRVSRVPAVTPAPYAVVAFAVDNIEVVVDALFGEGRHLSALRLLRPGRARHLGRAWGNESRLVSRSRSQFAVRCSVCGPCRVALAQAAVSSNVARNGCDG